VASVFADRAATADHLSTMAVAEPTLEVETTIDDPDVFEVKVYNVNRARMLVAVIELISPRNKDRAESRKAFATKCAAYLQAGVSVCLVDVVTTR
jgi:hypothetical protein